LIFKFLTITIYILTIGGLSRDRELRPVGSDLAGDIVRRNLSELELELHDGQQALRLPNEDVRGGALGARIDLKEAGHRAASQLDASAFYGYLVAGPALVLPHIRISHGLHHQHVAHGVYVMVHRAIRLQLRLVTGGVGSQGHRQSMVEPLDRCRWCRLHNALQMGTRAQFGVHHGLGNGHLRRNCGVRGEFIITGVIFFMD